MRPESGRERAQKLYPAPLGTCEADGCDAEAVDRHHIDGDTFHNERANVRLLCRRCHMAEDGRLSVFASTSVSRRGPQAPKPCMNCQRPSKPLRNGRCHACNEYMRRRGVERPYTHDGRRERVGRSST